jgi:voltage-gated potassium channel Kch
VQQDLFASVALEEAVAGGAMPPQPRRKRTKKRKRPPALQPHPCVVLGIDPGKSAGAAFFARGKFVEAYAVSTREGRVDVVRRARELAGDHELPLIVVAEKWGMAGPFASMLQYLGEQWGIWKEVLLDEGVTERRIVRVYPQTWYSAVVGGKLTRDKKLLVASIESRFKVRVATVDAACAVAMGFWGCYAADVGDRLPKRRATA